MYYVGDKAILWTALILLLGRLLKTSLEKRYFENLKQIIWMTT